MGLLSRELGAISVPDGGILSLRHVTVGILTALPKEYAALCAVLGCSQRVVAIRDGGDKEYRLGVVRNHAGQGGIVVAVALLLEMGNVPAATRATNLVNDCPNLKEILVCGIAGAVPNPTKAEDHVRMGDIVVSGDGVLQ